MFFCSENIIYIAENTLLVNNLKMLIIETRWNGKLYLSARLLQFGTEEQLP